MVINELQIEEEVINSLKFFEIISIKLVSTNVYWYKYISVLIWVSSKYS